MNGGMSRYAIIAGEGTDSAAYADQLASFLENEDVLSLSPDDEFDDDLYDDISNCTAVLGLGTLEDEQQTRLRQIGAENGIPVLSDQGYSGFRELDYDQIVLDGLATELERATDVYKSQDLKDVISGKDQLAIVIHRDPDPDALSSAYALQELSDHYNTDADIYYTGEITHQENRSLVNKIGIELKELEDRGALDAYDGTALLDTGITNSGLIDPDNTDSADLEVDIVIDHHAEWLDHADQVHEFFDVQRDRGSTASMVSDYYRRLEIEPSRDVATALLHGTRSDTHAFDPSKTFTIDDLETEVYLHRYADMSSLAEIVRSPMTEETADVLSRAIDSRTDISETTLFSYVGNVEESDALPQAADFLSKIKGVETALVAGVETNSNQNGTNIRVSARSRDIELDLGTELKKTLQADPTLQQFDPPVGGTEERAGAYIPLLFDTDAMSITAEDQDTLHRLRSHWLHDLFSDLGKE